MSSSLLRCGSRRARALCVIFLSAALGACASDGALDPTDDALDGENVGAQTITPDAAVASADAGAASIDASTPASADPSRNGPYAPETQRNVGPDGGFTLVAPRALAPNGKHPIITWGNGTGASPAVYTALLNRLASHGFVVIASNSPNTGSANEMLQGIDWVLAQNGTPGSALYQKLDPSRIGATGHSQGGFGTCAATRDPRITTIAPIQGFRAPAASYRGSIFAIAGKQDTTVSPTGIENGFNRLSRGPAVFGELSTATHVNWMRGTGEAGAAMTEAVVAWMRAELLGDARLRPRFYGADCGYCKDAAWRVLQKDAP